MRCGRWPTGGRFGGVGTIGTIGSIATIGSIGSIGRLRGAAGLLRTIPGATDLHHAETDLPIIGVMDPPVALFTAAGSGIGAAAARRLALEGWAVAILSPSGRGCMPTRSIAT